MHDEALSVSKAILGGLLVPLDPVLVHGDLPDDAALPGRKTDVDKRLGRLEVDRAVVDRHGGAVRNQLRDQRLVHGLSKGGVGAALLRRELRTAGTGETERPSEREAVMFCVEEWALSMWPLL